MKDLATPETREEAAALLREQLGKLALAYDVEALADELHRQTGTWDLSIFVEFGVDGRRLSRYAWKVAGRYEKTYSRCPSWCCGGPHRFEMETNDGYPLAFHYSEIVLDQPAVKRNGEVVMPCIYMLVEQIVTWRENGTFRGWPHLWVSTDEHSDMRIYEPDQARKLADAYSKATEVLELAVAEEKDLRERNAAEDKAKAAEQTEVLAS